jgi:hypothetical protein
MGHCGEFFMHYGPLRKIWLCAMKHCGGFGYVLWATGWNEAVVKICIDFCSMGHSTGFGYAQWAIAQGLVITMGSSEGFG